MHSFTTLGAIEGQEDARDFALASYQPPATIPPTFSTDFSQVPVFDQSMYPTCGGHAGATLDSFLQTIRLGTTTLSPKYLWKQIKLIDGYDPSMGTDMRSILKVLTDTGDCRDTLMPDTLGTSLADYTDPSKLTTAMKQDGLAYELKNYAFTFNPSFDAIKQAIYHNKAVILNVECGDGWWKSKQGVGSWNPTDIFPLRLGTFASGHFIVAYGYDTNFIYFRNSWSTQWGKAGNGWFDIGYTSHVVRLGTAINLPVPYVFTADIWYGQSSNDVLQLQKRLGVLPQTGYFGQITLAAVKEYQASKGIQQTGYCGTLTRTALNKG